MIAVARKRWENYKTEVLESAEWKKWEETHLDTLAQNVAGARVLKEEIAKKEKEGGLSV